MTQPIKIDLTGLKGQLGFTDAQINQLSAEADLQKQFAAGRLRQINKLGSELYTDSEGDR